MTETNCYRCDTEIDVQEDEWWSHSWEENPSKENVEKKIENKEFRDWFRENKVLCPTCHKDIIRVFMDTPAEQ